MNKKIISLFISAMIALCNISICVAEGNENILFDTAQQLSDFVPTNTDTRLNGDVLECEIKDDERSGIRTASKFNLKDYDNVNIRLSYENIDNPSSKALEYEGNIVPALRLGLKVIDSRNTMSNKFLDIFAEELISSGGYSTDGYVMMYGNLSDIPGYDTEQYTVYSITVYPAYGFSAGKAYIDMIELAAPLCDLGNMAVPTNILQKKSGLSPEENKIMRTHTTIGAEILRDVAEAGNNNNFIQMAIEIANYHHENWDGSGYPNGLKEHEIPLSAQIVGVVGSFCALTEDRTYRDAYSEKSAWDIMEQDAKVKYNPELFIILKKIARQLR